HKSAALRQRRPRRPGYNFSARGETRPMARAVPGRLGGVPHHEALHVGADSRYAGELALGVAIDGDLLAAGLDDLSFTTFHGARGFALGAGKPIPDEIVGIVHVLGDVIPETRRDPRAIDVEELVPGVFRSGRGVARHH